MATTLPSSLDLFLLPFMGAIPTLFYSDFEHKDHPVRKRTLTGENPEVFSIKVMGAKTSNTFYLAFIPRASAPRLHTILGFDCLRPSVLRRLCT